MRLTPQLKLALSHYGVGRDNCLLGGLVQLNIRLLAKTYIEKLPKPVAHLLARVPFSLRFYPEYARTRQLIAQVNTMDFSQVNQWTFRKLKLLIERTYAENSFYRVYYNRHGYHPDRLKSLAYFQDVPIVKKKDFVEFTLEERSVPALGRICVNTGGTSGEPLEFYVDNRAFAREWAHMHRIWERFGYNYRHLKLTLRGKNLGNQLLKYNAVHNEYIVNIYADKHLVAEELARLNRLTDVHWLHGYPSVAAEFCRWMADHRPDVLTALKPGLQGVLLGSEFPAPHYRSAITEILGVPIISWYGHSEMCVLAYEKALNEYVPFPTYGYCEAVPVEDGIQHLIGTSLWNTVSPFIRYDTGDGIKADTEQGFVRHFSILDGRIGEFVVDRNGGRIGLTALIFGRHHAGFEQVKHVQVRQSKPGKMELLIVPRDPQTPLERLKDRFDFSNVEIDVQLRMTTEPVRTKTGKTPLLIP